MKKLSVFLSSLILSVMFISCGNDADLKEMVREMNKACPIALGDEEDGTMDKVEYADGTVTLTYTVPSDALDYEAIRENETQFHKSILRAYANIEEEGFRMLIEAIVKAEATMKVVYRSDNGESHTLTFTHEELSNAVLSDNTDPEETLEEMVDEYQSQLPIEVDEELTCTTVDLDDNYCCFTYVCDEAFYNLAAIQESIEKNPEETKRIITNSSDPELNQLLKALKDTQRGIVYIYIGTDSGNIVRMTIEANEL